MIWEFKEVGALERFLEAPIWLRSLSSFEIQGFVNDWKIAKLIPVFKNEVGEKRSGQLQTNYSDINRL